jgi:hypothetical protein
MRSNNKIYSLINYLSANGHAEESSYLSKLATGPTDAELVAATLLGEAGGETNEDGALSINAMKAVYATIMNRVDISGWPISAVLLEANAYSWWNDKASDPSGAVNRKRDESSSRWSIALGIDSGLESVGSSTHYLNSNTAEDDSWSQEFSIKENMEISGNPCWVRSADVGRHTFGTDLTWKGNPSECLYSASNPQRSRCNCNRWPEGTPGRQSDRAACREYFKISTNFCYPRSE